MIVWRDISTRFQPELTHARLSGAQGTMQREGDVSALVAGRLFNHTRLQGQLQITSRDFH